MNEKRYSDISFLPAFLVPSTVTKFLFGQCPVDRLPKSVLTVSNEEKKKRSSHQKKVPTPLPFISNHTLFVFIYTQCCTVAGLLYKEKSDLIYPHLEEKNI